MSKSASKASVPTAKKPVPAPVKPQAQQARKKPVPSTLQQSKPTTPTPKPQTTTKKPVPPQLKPQNPTAVAQKKKAPVPSTATTRAPAKKAPTTTPSNNGGNSQSYVGKAVSAFTSPPPGPKADNWINRTVQTGVAGVGNYAGGWVNSVGDGVNRIGAGIGDSISNTTRHWGQGVAGYGNDIKDQVGIGGPRVPTAGNQIGLQGSGSGKGSAPGESAKGSGVRSTGGGARGGAFGLG